MIKSENGIVTLKGEGQTLISDIVCAAIAMYTEVGLSFDEMKKIVPICI